MPLAVTVNTIAECLWTDCNILGDNKKNDPVYFGLRYILPNGTIEASTAEHNINNFSCIYT